MSKRVLGTTEPKLVVVKRRKSEPTKPNRPRKKPYRGQGKP